MEQGHQGNMPQDAGAMETIPLSDETPVQETTSGQEAGIIEETSAADLSQPAADRHVPGAETTSTGTDAAAAAHQGHHQWAPQPLPPGYVVDPGTGQIVFVGPVAPQPIYQQSLYQQPVPPPQPGVVYVQAETPEQAAARQAMEQQRHGQIMQSFERFVQGDATVSDVVKTLYTNTAQYDQLWKGVLVGAAATVLLTSKPVREAMGKTFGSVFPGFKSQQQAAGKASTAVEPLTPGKE